ncbi:hypothetical protein DFP73DRAFT_572315 [Morchella snyderi]|nr:hypothetical protein DFP73DRAFT_572315 [Morchella snyderi]
MAAVSTATLTPPSSSHGRSALGGDWDFSVPIDGADTPDLTFRGSSASSSMPHRTGSDDHFMNSRPINDYDHVHQAKSFLPVDVHSSSAQNHVNDYRYVQQQPPSRGEGYSRSATPDLLSATNGPMLKRQGSTISSNHDGDSVYDLYGGGGGGGNGRMTTPGAVSPDSFEPQRGAELFPSDTLDKDDPDSSKWIDRDKLAKIEANDAGGRTAYKSKVDSGTSRWIDKDKLEKIENQELQRAGITVSRSRASSSTAQRGNENESSRDQKKQRISSPPSIEDEDEHIYNNPDEVSNDLRTPEEQAADRAFQQEMSPHRQFCRGASHSRIPVPTSSPFPIPQQFLERSAPLLRNTTPNGSDDERASLTNTFIRSRKRSHSAGSAFLLDDPMTALQQPGTISNPKNSSRNPTSPGGSPRKARNNSSLKQRTRSNPQLFNRPGTAASYATHLGNGGTGESTRKHHPEGPPPWSLQSYKTDPSLPPDQQIIPTVAKRMQQEQWERDGAPADVYDRDLRPLRVHGNDEVERARHRRTTSQGDSLEQKKEEWPLKAPTPPVDDPKNNRQDAGYKAMPSLLAASLLYFFFPLSFPLLDWGMVDASLVIRH